MVSMRFSGSELSSVLKSSSLDYESKISLIPSLAPIIPIDSLKAVMRDMVDGLAAELVFNFYSSCFSLFYFCCLCFSYLTLCC